VAAAFVVERLARGRGTLCLFDDTNIYWHLAGALKTLSPYAVSQFGISHAALRAPGYPVALALLRAVFGDATLPVRLAQAGLGAWSVIVLMFLVDSLTCVDRERRELRWYSPVVLSGLLAAAEPWSAGMSVLLLSEALFVPLMLVGLLGFVRFIDLSRSTSTGEAKGFVLLGTGAIQGAAILVKPSWALFPLLILLSLILFSQKQSKIVLIRRAVLVLLGMVLIMSPWWVRNARIYGRFVPTVLWFGASLYDGLNAKATGASDMRFLEAPDFRDLEEVEQDRVLRNRALEFAWQEPAYTLRLAAIKAARFWSPWPSADELRSVPLQIVSGVITMPLYVLIGLGVWRCGARPWVVGFLLGPLVYFALIHMVFVGSMRYRIPALVPALGLAGVALSGLLDGWQTRREHARRGLADA
jgi:4-amino-4-deoxy-L-arabinose transferase-like glycosyltransferase